MSGADHWSRGELTRPAETRLRRLTTAIRCYPHFGPPLLEDQLYQLSSQCRVPTHFLGQDLLLKRAVVLGVVRDYVTADLGELGPVPCELLVTLIQRNVPNVGLHLHPRCRPEPSPHSVPCSLGAFSRSQRALMPWSRHCPVEPLVCLLTFLADIMRIETRQNKDMTRR